MEDDLAFFRRRVREEYLAYSNASRPEEATAHFEIAKRYDQLARELDARGPPGTAHSAERDNADGSTLWL